jgi:hypothetical protein
LQRSVHAKSVRIESQRTIDGSIPDPGGSTGVVHQVLGGTLEVAHHRSRRSVG